MIITILAVCTFAHYYKLEWLEIMGAIFLIGLSMHLGYQFDRTRHYELESEKQTARMSALVSSLNSGILALDENRRIIHVNKEFCRMFISMKMVNSCKEQMDMSYFKKTLLYLLILTYFYKQSEPYIQPITRL